MKLCFGLVQLGERGLTTCESVFSFVLVKCLGEIRFSELCEEWLLQFFRKCMLFKFQLFS